MQKQKYRQYISVVLLGTMLSLGWVHVAVAEQSSSTNYTVTETQFGAGASLHDCSANYCAKTSAGDTVAGTASSDNYTAQFGSNTSDEPLLEVITGGGDHNLGVLDTDVTGLATNSIKIRSYLSNGYVLQISGAALNQGTHTITTLTTPSTSHQGAEQFGINLVANTSPAFGSDPVQVPSSSFSYGTVAADYSTPNLFKYVDGDIVAQSLSSSGETDYTVSMIVNVSHTTPGGHYNGGFSAIAVPVY